MATLTYSGELTADVSAVQSLIKQGVELHEADTPVSIDSGTLRLAGDGQIRVIISVSADGEYNQLTELEDQIAQVAVDLGFEPDVESATESIRL